MNFKKILEDSNQNISKQHPPESFSDRDFYANWLAQTYYFVTHSTTLLGYALPFLKDPNLRRIFEHHIGEESRHELLVLKDLEKLNLKIDSFSESVWTRSFYQTQYYKINFHGGPVLLGYILFLEGLAVTLGKDVYQVAQRAHNGASLFLKVHAEEDISHVSRAIKLVESLDKVNQKLILQNLLDTQDIYQAILTERKKSKQSLAA